MKFTNVLNLPEVLENAVRNDAYDPGESDVTVTGLIAPPRQTILRKRFDSQITEDIADRLWALFGQVAHGVLERAGEDVNMLTEERLYKMVEDLKVGGQVDSMTLVESENGWTITDYKFVTVWRFMDGRVPDEYVEQLNAYAAIFRANGFEVDRLSLLAMYRDWSVGRSKSGGNYPPKGAGLWNVPLWPKQTAEEWLIRKVLALKAADEKKTADLPECTPADRWEKQTTWAVMKEGRKSAVKIHYSQGDAETMLHEKDSKHYIDVRQGESIRCASYCAASEFCDQWAAIQKAQ